MVNSKKITFLLRLTAKGTVRILTALPRILFEKKNSSSYKFYEYRGIPNCMQVTPRVAIKMATLFFLPRPDEIRQDPKIQKISKYSCS